MIDHGPLIILGASARAAAQAAVRSGFRPYAIDLFGDLDLQQVAPVVQIARYPTEFLVALAAAPQAPWMYTGSLENYPRLVQRLARLRPLIGNGAEVLSKVRDPRWLGELLSTSAVRYPETVVGGGAEDRDRRSEVGQLEAIGDWLVKPIRSGGGMGIRRVNNPDSDLRPRNSDLLPSDFCLQRAIAGQPISASFVVAGGEVQWIGATEQWIGPKWAAPQEFQYAGSLAPLSLTADEQALLLEVARRLSQAAGLRGLFGLDLIRSEQGFWLIEVNPRYTASMELLEKLPGRLLIEEHCGLGFETPTQTADDIPRKRYYQAKLIIYAKNPGSCGKSLHETLGGLSEKGVISADVPRLGTAFQAGNPICTLLTGGAARAEIEKQLLSAGEVVRRALDH